MTTMMMTSTFDPNGNLEDVERSLPFDEGMVVYVPRIYPIERGANMDEAETQRRIEMEFLEQNLGEVLRVDLQRMEPRPGDKFFQAFVHLRWHDTEENRLLQMELLRANTLDSFGKKFAAPKLQVQAGFWMMMPRSREAAWRSNSMTSPGSPAEASFAAWLNSQQASRTSQQNIDAAVLAPTPPTSPASGSPNPCRRYVMARNLTSGGSPSGMPYSASPVEEYAREAGVSDAKMVADQCLRRGMTLLSLRKEAQRGATPGLLADACSISMEDAECIVRYEEHLNLKGLAGPAANNSALGAARAMAEEIGKVRETWRREGLEGEAGVE